MHVSNSLSLHEKRRLMADAGQFLELKVPSRQSGALPIHQLSHVASYILRAKEGCPCYADSHLCVAKSGTEYFNVIPWRWSMSPRMGYWLLSHLIQVV